jgi:ribonuclease BN (tRNA processing enzyme)
MLPGTTTEINGRIIEMIPVNHIVPTVGYRFQDKKSGKSFAFTGDTTTNDTFWSALNRHNHLDMLIVESAFGNKDEDLSNKAKHYCSKTLAADLTKLKHKPEIYLSHTKPGEEATIFAECSALFQGRNLTALKQGDRFKL